MKPKIISLILLGSLFLAACGSSTTSETSNTSIETAMVPNATSAVVSTEENTSTSTTTTTEVSFSKDIWPIIQEFALPAHGTQAKGGVFLENYDDIMKYVVPGDPEASDLYKYLTGNGVPVMPPSGKLPDATIQLFYDWIAQGAKNN